MKTRSAIAILLLASLSFSCSRNDNSEFTDTPIIESYLRPGDYFRLKVTRQIPFTGDVNFSGDNIDSLTIIIDNNGNTYTLCPLGDGNYIDSTIVVGEDEAYDLSFTFNSRHVTAYTNIPSKPSEFAQDAYSVSIERMTATSGPPSGGPGEMPDPLSLTWNNDDGSYYIVVIENMEETPDPIRDFGDETPPGNIFRKPPTTSSGLQLRPQEFQYFGRHRLILYHVLPDYASLYTVGSSSSQNLTNPSTSIINGYGIFTGLNADTLYFTVHEK